MNITLPQSLQSGAQKRSNRFSSKISTLICDNFETVRDRMSVIINS